MMFMALVSGLAAPARSTAQVAGKTKAASEIEYIRIWDKTRVRYRLIDLIGDPEPGPESRDLLLELDYSVRPTITPLSATINLIASSLRGFQYDEGRQLSVEVDGERIELGEMAQDLHRHDKRTMTMPESFHEALILTIPYAEFERIIKAKKVKLWVGKNKIGLSGSVLKKLRAYVEQISQEELVK